MGSVRNLASILLASCSLLTLGSCVRNKPLSLTSNIPPILRFQSSEETNIAHVRLQIEEGKGVVPSDYELVANILRDADVCLPTNKVTTPVEALNTFTNIHNFLKEYKFFCVKTNESQDFFNTGLKERKLDCDTYSTLYLGIGEKKGYPIQSILIPRHVFVQWSLPNGEKVLWETTSGKSLPKEYYIQSWKSNKWDIVSNSYHKDSLFRRPLEVALSQSISREEFIDSLPDICFPPGLSYGARDMYSRLASYHSHQMKLRPEDTSLYNRKTKALKIMKEVTPIVASPNLPNNDYAIILDNSLNLFTPIFSDKTNSFLIRNK